MTPPQGETSQYDRRRAEDVFRALETEIFPRLGKIDSKVEFLEHGVNKLMIEGCAHRAEDSRRIDAVDEQVGRIFEKIDCFGTELTGARVDLAVQVGAIKTDMKEQVGGIKVWVLVSVVIVLFAVAAYFLKGHFNTVNQHPTTVTQTK